MDGADPNERWLDPEARLFSTGAALVGASAAVFLLPLATAVGGAYAAEKLLSPASSVPVGVWQAGGMLVGLAVGVGVAKLVLMLVRSRQSISGGGKE